MFGELLGSIVAAPIRLASIPLKVAEKAVSAADEFMGIDAYEPPKKNVLDKAADAIQDACEEALDDK